MRKAWIVALIAFCTAPSTTGCSRSLPSDVAAAESILLEHVDVKGYSLLSHRTRWQGYGSEAGRTGHVVELRYNGDTEGGLRGCAWVIFETDDERYYYEKGGATNSCTSDERMRMVMGATNAEYMAKELNLIAEMEGWGSPRTVDLDDLFLEGK